MGMCTHVLNLVCKATNEGKTESIIVDLPGYCNFSDSADFPLWWISVLNLVDLTNGTCMGNSTPGTWYLGMGDGCVRGILRG